MDHVLGGEVAARCHDCLARRQSIREARPPDLFTLLKDLRAAGSVTSAIYPATAHQAGVGGIDDSIHLLLGDVTDDNGYAIVQE